VWFVVDALRADHTSVLGYGRPTTPNVDRLAEESLVFTNALSQSSATMLSFPSFLTGVDPGRLMWRVEKDRLQLAPDQPTLAQRLGASGYVTGFVTSDYFRVRLPGLLEGWSWTGLTTRKQTETSASAAALAASFITKARAGGAPFFLVIYLPAPHGPYVDHGAGYPSFGRRRIDRYDQEIVNADRYIGFVLDLLRADRQRWEDTVVVVTGDHGEEFGEHGGRAHATTCHHESLHVPIVLRIPGTERTRIDRRVGLVDLVPTILDLTGATAPSRSLDGQSLLLAAHHPELVRDERPLFCSVVNQKATQGSFFRRAVRSGSSLVMKDLRSGGEPSFYDLAADPGEQDPRPLSAGSAGQRLDAWLDRQLTSNLGDVPLGEEP
jgi:arylsulfatase A-like enzyme